VVHLSPTGGASAADLLIRLQERLGQVLEGEDLNALLAALVLRTMYRDPASSPREPAILRLAEVGGRYWRQTILSVMVSRLDADGCQG
jgi:hypothetical protein